MIGTFKLTGLYITSIAVINVPPSPFSLPLWVSLQFVGKQLFVVVRVFPLTRDPQDSASKSLIGEERMLWCGGGHEDTLLLCLLFHGKPEVNHSSERGISPRLPQSCVAGPVQHPHRVKKSKQQVKTILVFLTHA